MSIKHAMAILVAGVAALSTVATAQLPVPVPVKSKPVDPEPVEIIRTDFDPRELAEELERMRSKPEVPGQQLFVSRCAICHDPIGQPGSGETLGPWLDAELVSSKGEEAVRASILNGTANMPGFRHQFDAAQVDQVIAYMKTVPAEVRRWVPTEDRINAALWETPSAPGMHLAGTTTAASGEPLHGVAVSARRVESNYTTTVYAMSRAGTSFRRCTRGPTRCGRRRPASKPAVRTPP
jgi:cytochrome c5